MKAVYINKFGSSKKIIIGHLPKPKIKKDHIIVKTIATTINNVDTIIRAGKYPVDVSMPFLLGRDVVGEVVETFDSNSTFKKGDIVWSNSMGYENRQGVSAEYLLIEENRVFKLQDNIDPYQVVSGLHATTTAVLILTDTLNVKPNQSILIQGAAGWLVESLSNYLKF